MGCCRLRRAPRTATLLAVGALPGECGVLRGAGGAGLTKGVAAGQVIVQGLGMDVERSVEFLTVPLPTLLKVAQEVAEPHTQGRLGVPELGAEGRVGWRGQL